MPSVKSPIDEFLLSAQVMIYNALADPVVKAALLAFGYTEQKLMAGKTLYDEAMELQSVQNKEYGEQIAATAELNDLWTKADQQYMKTLKIARVALQDNAKADRAALLYGRRKESLSGWLIQTHNFYTNILNDESMMAALAEYGYPRPKLREEADLLEQVKAKGAKQNAEMGEAQAATQARDKKLDELAKWISDLRAVAKVALADDPQQLEKLGILARTSKAAKSQKPVESSQTTQTQ